MPPVATPRVAAGALFFDDQGRMLLVKPTYKKHWDIPGGYVEPRESPQTACIRELREELGISIQVGSLLVVDWAPAENEGDKLLFVFDGASLTRKQENEIRFLDSEISDWKYVSSEALERYTPARLTRRINSAIRAREEGRTMYTEHGQPPGQTTIDHNA